MAENESLSFGQRVYRALFKIFGPADVGRVGPPARHNPDDATVPPGYHLVSFVDERGIRHRIATPDNENTPNTTPGRPE